MIFICGINELYIIIVFLLGESKNNVFEMYFAFLSMDFSRPLYVIETFCCF